MRSIAHVAVISMLLLAGLAARCPAEWHWETNPPIDAAGYLTHPREPIPFRAGDGQDDIPVYVLPGDSVELRIKSSADINVGPEDFDTWSDPYPEFQDEEVYFYWYIYDNTGNPIVPPYGTWKGGGLPWVQDVYVHQFTSDDIPRSPLRVEWHVDDYGLHTQGQGSEDPGLPESADDPNLSGAFLVWVSDLGVGNALPDQNLNNAAGADRCNIRWADADPAYGFNVGYGDDFTLPAGQWEIYKIRAWAVPDVPVSPQYYLSDHYASVVLYGGPAGASMSAISTGTFTAGSGAVTTGDGTVITATRVTYSGGANYQTTDGRYNQIWQIDFDDLNWSVTGGASYTFGVHGVPLVDRMWFNHATNGTLAGRSQQGDGQIRRFDVPNPPSSTLVSGAPWFGGKGSDIDVQVFARPAQ